MGNEKIRCFSLFCIAITFLSLVITLNVNAEAEIPKVRLSVKPLDISRPPTNEEIMAAGQLGGQLYPTHELEDKERVEKINLSFGESIQLWNKHEYKKAVELFWRHVQEYPDSPWLSEAILHIGCDAQYNGRYKEAEECFQRIIDQNKISDHVGAKMLVNKARLRLGNQKVLQNNFNAASKYFAELKKEGLNWRDRSYASHWIQRLSRYKKIEINMLDCGVRALAYVLKKDGKKQAARDVIKTLPASRKGHSIKNLTSIARKYGYKLKGLRVSISELGKVPLPAIVQLSGKDEGDRGHYWVLEELSKNNVILFDPQSGRRFNQSQVEFSREWEGNIMVFSNRKDLPGVRLTQQQMAKIYGGCCGIPRAEDNLGESKRNKGPNSSEDKSGCGSPTWSVNMANVNLFVSDTPLWYSSPIGPSVEISLSYNSQSSIAYNEPFGNKWQFNYASYLVVDTEGQVTIFMPDGKRDTYTPDGNGEYSRPYQIFNTLTKIAENHFELKFPDDTVYVYNIPSNTTSLQPFLVEIRDAYGQKLEFGYDSDVQLTTITDALGRITTLTYNADGLVTQASDPFGRSAAFEYDSNRNLTKITDMGGYWSSLSYDDDVYLTGIENERGKWGFYIEPSDDNSTNSDNYPPPGDFMWENYRVTITNPLGGKEEYFYYGGCDEYTCGGYTWYVSPRDYIEWESQTINNFRSKTPKIRYFFTKLSSDKQGEILEVLYPEGGYILYGYDSSTGDRTSEADAHGHTINYAYNSMGRVTSVTDAKGITTTMNYDANGVDLLKIQDGLGSVTASYNAKHDILSVTDRLNNKTSFTYNSYGQLLTQTDALYTVTEYTYNSNHQLEKVTKDGKTLETFTYDSIGRVETHTDATGLTLSYEYNDLNNVARITFPDGKFVSYTYSSCCPHMIDSITDRTGQITLNNYDALKRLTETTNSEGGVTKYEYDDNGNLVKLIDPNGNATTFEYDNDNRLIKKSYADACEGISFTYDNAGILDSRTNIRGIKTSYSYDENHNLTSVTYSDDTPDVTYQYDNYNRMTQRQDGIGTYQYTYDANSRLKTVNGPWLNDTITYEYDNLGRRKSSTPQGGQTISYLYDNLSRLTDIKLGTATYSYSYSGANPLLESLSRPNNSITGYNYDELNRLKEISNKNSSAEIINQYVYGYNSQDMRETETITNGNPITSFQNESITYEYNNVNQLIKTANPKMSLKYDAEGNLTTDGDASFTANYDAENRLNSIEYTDTNGDAHKVEYLYGGDSFLAEVKKYKNGSLVNDTRFVRDDFLVLQERDGSNNVTREYTWGLNMGGGIGGLLNLKQGGQNYSYLYDGKGNVTSLIDNSQNVVAAYAYDPFGNRMSKTGSIEQPYQFSTKPYDEETGLSYYGYRFYAPTFGRWLTRDPIGETGGINLYGYVLNNPLNYIDSNGKVPIFFPMLISYLGKGVVGAATGAVLSGVSSFAIASMTGENKLKAVLSGAAGGAVSGGLAGLGVPLPIAGAAGGVASVATCEPKKNTIGGASRMTFGAAFGAASGTFISMYGLEGKILPMLVNILAGSAQFIPSKTTEVMENVISRRNEQIEFLLNYRR